MPRSTSSFLFPDINVWLALTYDGHVHHPIVNAWHQKLANEARLCFCRFTQLGLLRLLTTDAVMGSDQVLTQPQAWSTYDRCFADGRALLLDEPSRIEQRFRALSQDRRPAAKDWADSYLAAFAIEAGLCLVTLDQALYRKAQEGILLA
jgi:toxin-antitoxin system PIN domain toxin